jgi:hypothetical protein
LTVACEHVHYGDYCPLRLLKENEVSAESFANEIAHGRYQPEYSELRNLSAREIEDNLCKAEICYRALADGTAFPPEEYDDLAALAWREFVAEESYIFDIGRSPYDEYGCISEILALGRQWFLARWRFLQTPYGQASLSIEEEAMRLGIADQPEAVKALRRELALRIAADGARSIHLGDQTATEVKNERMPTTSRSKPKDTIPSPIADPKSFPPTLTPYEAAAVLRCTLGAFITW